MENIKYYAGIGSRETPKDILEIIYGIGYELGKTGAVLRSGGAQGADKAFEMGCDKAKGAKEIYIPWNGFNGYNHDPEKGIIGSMPNHFKEIAYKIASEFHPAWDKCSRGAKSMHSRNVHQVLGTGESSDLVICWTPNGSGSGGTGQAIRIAKAYGIPVFDLGIPENIELIRNTYYAK